MALGARRAGAAASSARARFKSPRPCFAIRGGKPAKSVTLSRGPRVVITLFLTLMLRSSNSPLERVTYSFINQRRLRSVSSVATFPHAALRNSHLFLFRDVAPEEVSSTEVAKESPVKKSPAKKVAEAPESNGKEENGSGDAPEDTPAENGDAEESNDATENGDATEKKEAGVKRKSVAADNGEAEKTTPEKKAKVADEAPPAEAEEAAA